MCDGSLGRKPEATQWAAAQAVAEQALDGYVDQEVGAATHYHADYVVPNWATTMFKLVKVGRHIFYRWPGAGALNLAPVIPPVDAGNDGLAAASVNSASSTEVSAAAAQSVKVELPPSPAPVEVAPSSSAPLTQPSAAPAQLPPPPPRPPHRAIPDSSLRVGPLQ